MARGAAAGALARPRDERLTTLLARRSTLDWVLRNSAAAQPGVRLIGGTRVTGLLAQSGQPPLQDPSGSAAPPSPHLVYVGFLRFLTVAAMTADNDTMTVALGPLAEDRPLRALRRPAVHAAVTSTINPVADWLEVLDPISEVYAMGGLHNTLRRLVLDGQPAALGLHAVGDSVCTTNPTFGRGPPLPDVAGNLTPGHVRAAAMVDPDLHRVFASVISMLRLPAEVYGDPEVQARTRAVFAAGAVLPPPEGPTRADLLAAVERST